MPSVADTSTSTLGRARLSFTNQEEIEVFVETLGAFERGEISPDEWRAFRLLHGTYGQRQDGVHMLRVKVPQGILSAAQLDALADVAGSFSRGFAHITTRQNVQLHFVTPTDLEAAIRRLGEAGLTTREACGNTVRNITTCAIAGVAGDELFDVTPYAEGLTRHLLRHPLGSTLPRKFKIAFEGCVEDHAVTAINDLGFRAAIREDLRGFRVTAGGGTGILPVEGRVLFDFLPAAEILAGAEAVLQVFHRRGDREHKERNRMKFLIRQMSFELLREEVLAGFAAGLADDPPHLPFDAQRPPEEGPPSWPRPEAPSVPDAARAAEVEVHGPGLLPVLSTRDLPFEAFEETNVRRQRQDGFSTVTVTLPLGDVTAGQLRLLGRLATAYGDGTVRTTHAQNLLLRWVRTAQAPELFRRLAVAGLASPGADSVVDVTSCPGAESCRVAVTHSRGLGRILGDHLKGRPQLAALAPDLKLKVSGCPNGCSQHHIAGIGFQGSARQVGGRTVPQYFVMAGGEVTPDGVFFAKTVARVPARRVPQALERLLGLYRDEKAPGETAPAFFRRLGPAPLKNLLSDLERLTAEEARPEDYVDPGQDEASSFQVDVMTGECAT